MFAFVLGINARSVIGIVVLGGSINSGCETKAADDLGLTNLTLYCAVC
jgi:hypothetical protein